MLHNLLKFKTSQHRLTFLNLNTNFHAIFSINSWKEFQYFTAYYFYNSPLIVLAKAGNQKILSNSKRTHIKKLKPDAILSNEFAEVLFNEIYIILQHLVHRNKIEQSAEQIFKTIRTNDTISNFHVFFRDLGSFKDILDSVFSKFKTRLPMIKPIEARRIINPPLHQATRSHVKMEIVNSKNFQLVQAGLPVPQMFSRAPRAKNPFLVFETDKCEDFVFVSKMQKKNSNIWK